MAPGMSHVKQRGDELKDPTSLQVQMLEQGTQACLRCRLVAVASWSEWWAVHQAVDRRYVLLMVGSV